MKVKSFYQATVVALALVAASKGAVADTVLITGANSGIGLEFATQYAAKGWTVIATQRRCVGDEASGRPDRCPDQ